MTETARPQRADAARNRARVLAVAYESMATDGVSVPIDEIARRAGVGAGTVYRHFPTKEALFGAVIEDRLQQLVLTGRTLLESDEPGQALFAFVRAIVVQGAVDLSLAQAMAGQGVDVKVVAPQAEAQFLGLLGELLTAARKAGSVRPNVTVPEAKALIVGCQAMQGYNADVSERVVEIVLDGLRAKS